MKRNEGDESGMAKWIMIAETNCTDVAREAEFNEWYDGVHVPDVLECPGFITGKRYEFLMPWTIQDGGETTHCSASSAEQKAKFMAIYEIEADDPSEAMRMLDIHLAEKAAQGRWSALVELTSMTIYKSISTLSKG